MSNDINSKEMLRRLLLDPKNAAGHAAKLLLLDKTIHFTIPHVILDNIVYYYLIPKHD